MEDTFQWLRRTVGSTFDDYMDRLAHLKVSGNRLISNCSLFYIFYFVFYSCIILLCIALFIINWTLYNRIANAEPPLSIVIIACSSTLYPCFVFPLFVLPTYLWSSLPVVELFSISTCSISLHICNISLAYL